MRSLVAFLMLTCFLPSGVWAASVQREKTEALCTVLEKLYGKDLSLEKPFALYYGIKDWREDPSGKSRSLPSATLTIGVKCVPEKASVLVTLTSTGAAERAIEGKLKLDRFHASLQKQLFTVDEKGEIKAEITYITTVNTTDIPVPPSTYPYKVDLNVTEATLVTDVVIDDFKTDKQSCYDDKVSPTAKVACRASMKTILRREGEKTIAHLDKSAQFYDAEWKLLPNTGWKIGPEQVATSDWKDVQAAYQNRTAP